MNTLINAEDEQTIASLRTVSEHLTKEELVALGKTCRAANALCKKWHCDNILTSFTPYLYSDGLTVPHQLRRGVIRRRNPNSHRTNTFFPHQVKVAVEVIAKDIQIEWKDRYVRHMLFWCMGTGKTMAAMAIASAVHIYTPTDVHFTALVVVPLAVLSVWKETVLSWMDVNDENVVATSQEHRLTASVLATATIVITTPECITSALKTFMWKNPHSIRFPATNYRQTGLYVSGYERRTSPIAKHSRTGAVGSPPVHPLFSIAPTLMIVDECHLFTNASSTRCYAINKITKISKYVIAMSGTPFNNSPNEASGLFKTMSVNDTSLWNRCTWTKPGCSSAIRYDTVRYAHSQYISRVTSFVLNLPPKRVVRVNFHPFVGEGSEDDTTSSSSADIALSLKTQCLQTFENAVREARSLSFKGSDHEQQMMIGKLLRSVSTMEQGYMDRTLCIRGASGYGVERTDGMDDAELSLRSPSRQCLLLHKIIRSRQRAGRTKIVVFTTQVKMVEIASNFLRHAGGCGVVIEYTGKRSVKERDMMISTFLSNAVPKGVMFITKAGGVGVTLCPGCETFVIFGSYPWSNEEVRQAAARVHRIGQSEPVEEILLVPIASTTASKVDNIYRDKDERLVRLLRDADSSGFASEGDKGVWRLYQGMASSVRELDACGNHVTDVEWTQGGLMKGTAGDADIPPVSYPVPGFEEGDDPCCYDDMTFEFDGGRLETTSRTSGQMSMELATPQQAASFAAAWIYTDDDDDE